MLYLFWKKKINDAFSFFPSPKVPGGTQPDLTLKAVKTQCFVCRVNDHSNNCAFSEWVKVKVLDTDKSGKLHCDILFQAFLFSLLARNAFYCCDFFFCFVFKFCFVLFRFAGGLAGRAAHRPQPQTANGSTRWKTYSAMCCLRHPSTTLPVVQKWPTAAGQDEWHAAGTQVFTYLPADSGYLNKIILCALTRSQFDLIQRKWPEIYTMLADKWCHSWRWRILSVFHL